MNQSVSSIANSHLSLKSTSDLVSPQLLGYLYDIPKSVQEQDLKEIFTQNHIPCEIQIKRTGTAKPFDSAMVKFFSSAHIQVASEKLRYFKTKEGHRIRFLPYETNLYRGKTSTFNSSQSNISNINTSFSQKLNNSHLMFEEDPEALMNLPDNSHLECNICVTGLDESLTSEDLHTMFARFGEIKSCKVTLDPKAGLSRGYGFVWFTTERACRLALKPNEVPYKTMLYRDYCLRAVEPMFGKTDREKTVVISGYPTFFKEKELLQLMGAEKIEKISLKKNRAEITFYTVKDFKTSLSIDGVAVKNGKLSVKPLIVTGNVDSSSEMGPNNLYVRELDKAFDESQVRRAFAMFGKIQSFRLVNKIEFTTNIAYVAYTCHHNAKLAFENAVKNSKLG